MLIYLVGQDKKCEDGEAGVSVAQAADAPTESRAQDSPHEIHNPLGLDLGGQNWDDNVQEERQCTFSRCVCL